MKQKINTKMSYKTFYFTFDYSLQDSDLNGNIFQEVNPSFVEDIWFIRFLEGNANVYNIILRHSENRLLKHMVPM